MNDSPPTVFGEYFTKTARQSKPPKTGVGLRGTKSWVRQAEKASKESISSTNPFSKEWAYELITPAYVVDKLRLRKRVQGTFYRGRSRDIGKTKEVSGKRVVTAKRRKCAEHAQLYIGQ